MASFTEGRKKKKRRNQLELFVFTRRSVSYLLVKRKCPFPLLSFFYCSTLPDHIESKKSWIYIHPVVEGEKQNKTSDHKQLIWSNLIRPVLLPPAGQGVTAQSAMQRLRRHFFTREFRFPLNQWRDSLKLWLLVQSRLSMHRMGQLRNLVAHPLHTHTPTHNHSLLSARLTKSFKRNKGNTYSLGPSKSSWI